jgi:hypothetical protein
MVWKETKSYAIRASEAVMKALDIIEDIVRGNPDFEPAVHALRYVLLWIVIKLG